MIPYFDDSSRKEISASIYSRIWQITFIRSHYHPYSAVRILNGQETKSVAIVFVFVNITWLVTHATKTHVIDSKHVEKYVFDKRSNK